MKTEALKYQTQGWSVIPIGKDKLPLVKWLEFQSRKATVEEIEKWWSLWPGANIGVVTGAISNITVVDFDVKSGGLETLKNFHLPVTLVAKTGGGGWHYFFKFVPGASTKAAIYPGVDIRSEGGYVVVFPSLHSSGNKYEWVTDEDIADFPLDIIPLDKLKKEKLSDKKWEEIIKDGVVKGNRNEALTKVAGLLFNRIERGKWGMVKELCYLWGTYRCTPPIPQDEINATLLSIANRQLAKEASKWVAMPDWEFAKLSAEEKKKIVEENINALKNR